MGLFEESQEKLLVLRPGPAMGGDGAAKRNEPLVSSCCLCVCDPEQHVEHPGAAWSHCKPCADVGTRAPKDTLGHGMSREEHASQQQLEGGKNVRVTQTQPHVGPQGRFRLFGGCLATAGTGHGEAAGPASHAAGELPDPRAPRERECWVPGGFTLEGLDAA